MQPESDSPSLTPAQLHALFDILTHHETYDEVEKFKYPQTISRYGFPFVANPGTSDTAPEYASESSAPLLASLLRTIVLPLPGVRDLPPEFWSVRSQGILSTFAEAELSESYDKGVLGTRKTLATAASVIHEYVSRGYLGGFPQTERRDLNFKYDPMKADDLNAAWDDVQHEIVYGDLIDELFDCAIEKDSLEEHSPAVKMAVDYIIIHLATFMHHILVLSPEGQYLLKLVENVHKLLPYSMIKQTLRIGNAATMISGMVKLLLTKMSIGALTNWVGWTQNAEDGMNLLQRIISMVLSWDSSEFRKSAEGIEKKKGRPSKEQFSAIKQYIDMSRDKHEALRAVSKEEPESIVAAIFEDTQRGPLASLSEAHHAQCLEYYSARLSIRDREQITNVLCRGNPDLFTQALRDLVASFEPMIRSVHERVDIREHLAAAECFINDFITTSKAKKAQDGGNKKNPELSDTAPSVEDYVSLLRRNRQFLYNWLHQFAANCPEVRESFREWAKNTIKTAFAQKQQSGGNSGYDSAAVNGHEPPQLDKRTTTGAGDMSAALQVIYSNLGVGERKEVLDALDAHAQYLSQLSNLSTGRMQRILDNLALIPPGSSDGPQPPTSRRQQDSDSSTNGNNAGGGGITSFLFSRSSRSTTPEPGSGPTSSTTSTAAATTATTPKGHQSMCGPGMFLARWQDLLDTTFITPATATGPVRTGRDVKGSSARGKTGVLGPGGGWDSGALAKRAEADVPRPPRVDAVVRELGPAFREVVVGLARRGGEA